MDLVYQNTGKMTRTVHGQMVVNSTYTEFDDTWGNYFFFEDLSIAVGGQFTLRVNL
ncbi:hypothetical protein H4R33_004434 [Dimargaris cristalligena]|nr:hypothetical protein H4R33_004434 [Dimargaris cristalligena]